MTRQPITRTALALMLTVAACGPGGLEQACREAGLCAAEPREPEVFTMVCDASRGSGCTPESLRESTSELLQHVVKAPGSRLDVWTMGADVAATELVAQVRITPPKRTGLRAREAEERRQVEEALAHLTSQVQPYFDGAPPGKSPLISTMGKIALLTPEPAGPWHLVIASDGLVFGELGFDLECSPWRNPEKFRKRVQDSGILASDALARARVSFVYMDLGPVDGNRCATDVATTGRLVRELWELMLTSVGASSVTFSAGPPTQAILDEAHDFHDDGGVR